MAEKTEVDPTTYLDKPWTSMQTRFKEYLLTEAGYDPTAAKSKAEAFAEGVRLGTALRMVFQASDFNKEGRATEQAARASEEKPAPAKKAAPKKAAKPAPVEETDEGDGEEVAEEKPAAVVKPAARKAAPAAKPAARPAARRAPAKRTAAASADEAPF